MREKRKGFFLRKGGVLAIFLLVVFGLTFGCTACGKKETETKTQADKCQEQLTKVKTTNGVPVVDQSTMEAIKSACLEYENNPQVKAVLQKEPIVYNYFSLIKDVEDFLYNTINAVNSFINYLNTNVHSPAYQQQAVQGGDAVEILKDNILSSNNYNLFDDIDDALQRVTYLAKQSPDKVKVKLENFTIKLPMKNIIEYLKSQAKKDEKALEVLNKVEAKLDSDGNMPVTLDGIWDYTEVLLIGAFSSGFYAAWDILESQTLGNLSDLLGIYHDYQGIKDASHHTYFITGLLALELQKHKNLLAFEPTEGKTLFGNKVRLFLDGMLSYLTGRKDDLVDNGFTYAVANQGLYDTITAEMQGDQSENFIQFNDKGDKGISPGDEIVIQGLYKIDPSWGSFLNPLKDSTWKSLRAFAINLEAQLEYKSTESVDIADVLNPLFKDLVDFSKADVTVPEIPSKLITLNAANIFKAATKDSNFKGLRSLLPAWVNNPRYDTQNSKNNQLDADQVGTRKDVYLSSDGKTYYVFPYLLVVETEEYYSNGISAVIGDTINGVNYFAITPVSSDPEHFSLFFSKKGTANAAFYGDTQLSTNAYLGNVGPINADSLQPTKGHKTLYYVGLQQPDFFNTLNVDLTKLADSELTDCKNVPTNDDPLYKANVIVNCAILEYADPISAITKNLSLIPTISK